MVEEHYAEREDGVLQPAVLGTNRAKVDFTYSRMSPEGSTGERVELDRDEPTRDLGAAGLQGSFQPKGTIKQNFRVTATYEKDGLNPHIEGLAKMIAEEVQARISTTQASQDLQSEEVPTEESSTEAQPAN